MIFDRTELRNATQYAIDRHQADHDERIAEYERADVEARREWVKRNGNAWLDACKTIAKKIRNGEVVTREDLPRDTDGTVDAATYRGPYESDRSYRRLRRPGTYTGPPTELVKLRNVLDFVENDKVSTNGLKELGVGQSVFARVLPYLDRKET